MKHADNRPRIHIWQRGSAVAWSIGPTGARTPAETHGSAVDAALALIGLGPAVVIVEPAV